MTTRAIPATDLQVGMIIFDRKRSIEISTLDRGQSCNGMHVNAVRRPSHVKVKGKWLPNLEAGQLLHSDGCYDRAATVTVRDGG